MPGVTLAWAAGAVEGFNIVSVRSDLDNLGGVLAAPRMPGITLAWAAGAIEGFRSGGSCCD